MLKAKFMQNIPELDTTSTADISFILLIFFLMTTSMTVERGMRRKLPPVTAENEAPQMVKKENLMVIDIMPEHVVMCNEEITDKSELAGRVAEFARDDSHVISIRTDGDAAYEDYFYVQQIMMDTAKKLRKKIKISESGLAADNADSVQEGGEE